MSFESFSGEEFLGGAQLMSKEPCKPDYEQMVKRARIELQKHEKALALLKELHTLDIPLPGKSNVFELIGHVVTNKFRVENTIDRLIVEQEKENK